MLDVRLLWPFTTALRVVVCVLRLMETPAVDSVNGRIVSNAAQKSSQHAPPPCR